MAALSYVVLKPRAVIEVGGRDRVAFLQGLVSNDVTKVSPERAIHAALLTAQGRYLHDFFIYARDDLLLIETEAARLDDLRRRLTLYKLRTQAAISSRDWLVAVAWGSGTPGALGLREEPGAARRIGNGIAAIDPRLAALGARILMPPQDGMHAIEALGFGAADGMLYERMRIEAGVPDGSRDLVVDKSLIVEAGFDELNGIDWQKGCYVGQELTARMKYRALVKKRTVPVAVEGEPPRPGTAVMLGNEEVGEIRSGVRNLALAHLRLDAIAQTETGAALSAGGVRVVPRRPHWLQP